MDHQPIGAPKIAGETALSFTQTIRARRSFRAFRPDPVPHALIEEVLQDAQFAPSNCNTQPWNTHIVSDINAHETKLY